MITIIVAIRGSIVHSAPIGFNRSKLAQFTAPMPFKRARRWTEMRNWLLVLWRAKFRTEWERGDMLGSYKTWLMREVRKRWVQLGERQKWNLQKQWQQGLRRPLDDQDDAALNEDPTVFEADSAISDLDDSIEEELKNRHDLDCFELQEVPREELLEPASEQVDGASHVGAAALPIAEVDEAPDGDEAGSFHEVMEIMMYLKRLKEDSHVDVAESASEVMSLKRLKADSHCDAADPACASSTSLPAIVSSDTYPMANKIRCWKCSALCSTETEDSADSASVEVNDVPRDDAVIGPVSSLETQPEPDICPHARMSSLKHRPIWCTHQNNPINFVCEYEGARLLFLTSLLTLWTDVLSEADSYVFLGENLKMLEAWFHPSKQYPAAIPMDSKTMSAITIRITFDCHYNDSCADQDKVVYESFVFLRIRASNVLKFKVLAMTGAAYACKRQVKRPRISDRLDEKQSSAVPAQNARQHVAICPITW